MGSPGSGRAACAASRPGGRAPLCGAAWHPVVVLSRAFALRPPPGTGEEEAERCGGPGCVTARIDSSAHLLSSSQVTARDALPRAGRFAGSPHLLARSAHVGRVCPWALTPGRGGLAAGALPGVQGSHLGWKGRRLSHLDPPRQHRQDVALLGVSYRHAATAAGSIGPPRSGGPDGDI